MNRITRLAVLLAASCVATTAVPALAQSASDDARFEAAQQRFASEMATYRAEFDRYQAARRRGGGGYPPARQQGYDPRNGSGYDRDPRSGGGYDQGYDPRADDRDENGYDASRYYRSGGSYQERTLGTNDRVYRGSDGQYYCKRGDGTTGLVVGAAAGGVLGNVIDGGHSRTVGTLLGAALGGLAGRSVDQSSSQVRCR